MQSLCVSAPGGFKTQGRKKKKKKKDCFEFVLSFFFKERKDIFGSTYNE
jgi:hypothetical protein